MISKRYLCHRVISKSNNCNTAVVSDGVGNATKKPLDLLEVGIPYAATAVDEKQHVDVFQFAVVWKNN